MNDTEHSRQRGLTVVFAGLLENLHLGPVEGGGQLAPLVGVEALGAAAGEQRRWTKAEQAQQSLTATDGNGRPIPPAPASVETTTSTGAQPGGPLPPLPALHSPQYLYSGKMTRSRPGGQGQHNGGRAAGGGFHQRPWRPCSAAARYCVTPARDRRLAMAPAAGGGRWGGGGRRCQAACQCMHTRLGSRASGPRSSWQSCCKTRGRSRGREGAGRGGAGWAAGAEKQGSGTRESRRVGTGPVWQGRHIGRHNRGVGWERCVSSPRFCLHASACLLRGRMPAPETHLLCKAKGQAK